MKLQTDPSEFFKLIRRFDPNPWMIRTSNEYHKLELKFQSMNTHEDTISEHTVHEKELSKRNRGFVYQIHQKILLQKTRAAYL